MRKILSFLFILPFIFGSLNSQTLVKTIDYVEDFQELINGDAWGFTGQIPPAVIESGKEPNTGKVLQWDFSNQSGGRTGYKDLPVISVPDDGILNLDFDWHLGVPTNGNTCGIFFRFKDTAGNIAIAFSVASNNGTTGNALHFVNLDNSVTTDATAASTLIEPVDGSFARDTWVNIHASLNYKTKTVDKLVVTNGIATYTVDNTPFYSSDASSLSRFEVYANRDKYNITWTGQLTNFEIYHYEEVSATADVTVKFKDQNDDYFKADEVVETLPVGSEYLATLAQKASYNDGTNVYVLDPSSPTSVASVDATGSTLELLFRKSPVYESVSWVGSVDENGNLWSDWYQNFVNNSVATSSQANAEHYFGIDGVVKDVVVNSEINVGTGSVVIEDNGYSFTGAGSLKGSGALIVDLVDLQSVSLGLPNYLTGQTIISGGNVTVAKAGALGASVAIKGASSITTSVAQTLPKLSFEDDGEILADDNRIELNGLSVIENKKVSISSSHDTNNDFAIGINPVGTLESGAELELNGEGTENKFGLKEASATYLANAKVTLKGKSFLYIEANQPNNTPAINIGSLVGGSDSKLGWGNSIALDRTITWSVGALNEDSEFAGTITNTGGYSYGSTKLGDLTNLTKVGTGVLTLSGNSSEANSVYTVNGGTLNVTGAIASATSQVVVSENGTLKGNGSVGGTATINGVLDQVNGYLTLNDVVLAGTLNIKADEAKFATVVGNLVQGGVLNVTISQDPSESKSIKLINVTQANISGEFNSVTLPSEDYTLSVENDGVYLNYVKVSTGITNTVVDVKSVQYYNVAGNQVSENSNGILIKKTIFVDGSSKVEKIVNK